MKPKCHRMSSMIKIIFIGLNEDPLITTSIANRLAGFENNFFADEIIYAPVRILEISRKGNFIELWNVAKADTILAKIYTYQANGLIIVSKESPAYFLSKNKAHLELINSQILWLCSDENNRNMSLSHLGFSVHQVNFTSLSDELINHEFNNWINKLLINQNRHY